MAFSWTCPYCNRPTTVQSSDVKYFDDSLKIENKDGFRLLLGRFIVCPNEECKRLSLTLSLHEAFYQGYDFKYKEVPLKNWQLIPDSKAKPFPSYVPKAILDDYNEACLIIDLSPKAAATLARRCLQGMIRNYWTVSGSNLYEEIDLIKEKVDPVTWKAVDGVRSLGNIGAHMQKDINQIIRVDPGEAEKLIELIELLIKDWYITRHEREKMLESIINSAKQKKTEKSKK